MRFHSITSSARASKGAGTSRPSVLAVLRLMNISPFVSCCAGKLAGFSPLRIRPGKSGLTVLLGKTTSVAQQTAGGDKLAKLEDRGHCIAGRQFGEMFAPASEESVGADHEPAGLQTDQS